MTGSQLSKLRIIPEYDPVALCERFETVEYAEKKDRELAGALERASRAEPSRRRSREKHRYRSRLISGLENDGYDLDIECMPLSSWIQKRETRRKVVSNVAAFLCNSGHSSMAFITPIDYRLAIPLDELDDFDLAEANSRFQKAILKRLKATWRGCMFAFWEMEYEPNRDHVQFHAHIIATDDVRVAVERHMRHVCKVSRAKTNFIKTFGDTQDISHISKAELSSLIGYAMKPEIKARLITFPDENGKTKRAGQKHFMSDNVLTTLWLFMDNRVVSDVITLIGVRATKDGFISTRRGE